MATTKKQQQFCMKVYRAAYALYMSDREGTVSPRFTTAQAMLESAWGNKAIGNNIFGMTKGSSWTGKTRLVQTTEIFTTRYKKFTPPEKVLKLTAMRNGNFRYTVLRLFRDYDTLEEAIRDHNELFKKPMYADAWPHRLYAKEFAKRISDAKGAKYATDPNYYRTMWRMIDSVNAIIDKNK